MNRKTHRGLAFPPLVLGAKLPELSARQEDEAPADETHPATQPVAAVEAMLEPETTLTLDQPEFTPVSASETHDDGLQPIDFDAGRERQRVRVRVEKVSRSKPPKAVKAAKPEKPAKPAKVAKEKAPKPERIEAIAEARPAKSDLNEIRLPVWGRYAYPAAITLAVLWAGTIIGFPAGYLNHDGPFEFAPFPITVFGALALLPAAFMILCAYVVRQAARLSLETERARALADELAIPAALAADQAGGAAEAVRREVERATQAGEAAERQLLSLRQSLADESERLIAATGEAERTARTLTENLSRERIEMAAMAAGLDSQVVAVNDAVARQTRMVADTSDLAAAQLQEAEAALTARATDLAAAAGEAGEAAELAGEALARQAERLETVGELVGTRLQALNDDFGRGHSRLADLAVQLQADQESLANRLEAQRLSAAASVAEAQNTVAAAADTADAVAASLRDLIAEADERLRAVAETVQGEQAALDARARASLSLFRDAVAEERVSIEAETQSALAGLIATAEDTRRAAAASLQTAEAAAAAHAEAARAQVEQLGEAAFAAGQKADQAFDTRISAARRAIEQSAALVEEAGMQSVGRIDAGLAAARAALGELETLLTSVDQRIAAVPDQTRAQAAAVRAAVEGGLAEIAASASKIAADTQAVDNALQERVRRNYEMLSDALKTMGKVASVTEQAAARAATVQAQPAPRPAPLLPPVAAPQPQAAAPRPTTPAAAAFAERAIRVPPAPAPAPTPEPALRPSALSSGDFGLRPRLRLTPEHEIAREAAPAPAPTPAPRAAPVTHETLDAFHRPAPTRQPTADLPKDTSAWTWKDLLSSIDEPPIDDEVLAERLISEIEALGMDAATLLPLSQIDAIAVAMQRGDVEGVRAAVRGLAPGAVRRLSRRILTDKVLRAQADRYVRRYEDLLNDSARRDNEGFMTAALLGSEPGRAFLLFDAAVGELH